MGLLRRLVGGAPGLTREQEALLARHEERGLPLLEPLVLDLSDPSELAPDELVSVVVSACSGIRSIAGLQPWEWWFGTREAVARLVRRRLPWTLEDVELMFALARRKAARPEQAEWQLLEELKPAISAAERFARDHGVDPLRPTLEQAFAETERLRRSGWEREVNQIRARLRKLLEQGENRSSICPWSSLTVGERLSVRVSGAARRRAPCSPTSRRRPPLGRAARGRSWPPRSSPGPTTACGSWSSRQPSPM
jgi:hypothetical protein